MITMFFVGLGMIAVGMIGYPLAAISWSYDGIKAAALLVLAGAVVAAYGFGAM